MHLPVEARESLCIAFEACIHASKGAHVLDDHVEVIEFFFYLEYIFWIMYRLESLSGGIFVLRPLQGSAEPVVAGISFYHIL